MNANTSSLGVNLSDYADRSSGGVEHGSATASYESLQELNKALEAGSITGNQSMNTSVPGQGAALKVESLENNLKVLSFRDQDIRLWKRIPKLSAMSTVEEYNQLESYGIERGGFNLEGELPKNEDSTYVRRSQLVKFLGVTKSVTHPMQLVSLAGIASAIQQEIKNGTMWILRKVDRAIAFADATVIPQEFNGLYAQQQRADVFGSLDAWQDSTVVIDLRGMVLTQAEIETGAEAILEQFGMANLLFAPPLVLSNFAKDFYQKQRILLGQASDTNFVAGAAPKSVSTTVGEIELQHDTFLRKAAPRTIGSGATSTDAPGNPITTSLAVTTATNSRFVADDAGDYLYAIAAVNRNGESGLVAVGTATTIAAGDVVDLTFTDGGGANPATGYVVYRSKLDDASGIVYPIFSVSTSEKASGYDGATAAKVRDLNRFLPDTDSAFMIQNDTDVYSFKQLAPLMKMDLAVLSPATRFMILLYGTPILYAPKKMVRFINIGRTFPTA
jgi:hypothetical protein